MYIKFINKIDQLRKVADFFAVFIFFILGYYLYKNGYYKLSYFIYFAGFADVLFTYDAIKLHGFSGLFEGLIN
jgi:hypothetical protein